MKSKETDQAHLDHRRSSAFSNLPRVVPIGHPQQMQAQARFSEAVLLDIRHLRAYARLMTNDLHQADGQVEETLRRALTSGDRMFTAADLAVQLLTILRGLLIAGERTRNKLAIQSTIYEQVNRPFIIGNQTSDGERRLASALMRLEYQDREALVLNASGRFDHLEAAEVCGCDVIEYKARLYSGRVRFKELLTGTSSGATSAVGAPRS
jgi:RNA polymerase sigma-70 factor (ECF subfamily)